MIYENFIKNYPEAEYCLADINKAVALICDSYKADGKLLLCGNGGSCADCEHISGELLKGFLSKRPLDGALYENIKTEGGEELAKTLQLGLPALPLCDFSALCSAYANDCKAEYVYAQLTLALGKPGDVLLGISTSGGAKNVRAAFAVARATGIKTIALTGMGGDDLRNVCDVVITAPASETYRVQEYHLPIYHLMCAMIEKNMFK